MSERADVYHARVSAILLRLATENDRRWWEFWKPRFPYHHEPLRHDAANLIRYYHGGYILRIDQHLVGEQYDGLTPAGRSALRDAG